MVPHSPPAALRLVGALARAVFAAAALAALLVGAPYAMLRWGHLPTSLPPLTAVKDFLSGPADDSVLLTVLTLIGLVAWLFFIVVPVVLEVGALLRHRAAPRIRALSPFQGAASFLVGSIVLLAPTAASAATAAATPAAAATAQQHVGQSAPDARPAATTRTDETVRYVATGHDTLWDIAQTHLGNGLRWREIAALNPDLADPLADGTVVRLPAEARTADPAANTPHTDEAQAKPAAATTRTYTVRTGDDLSEIAEHQLGDAGAWPKVYDLNKGQPLPDGGHFEDPNLIYPGQQLNLPGATSPVTPPAAGDSDTHHGTMGHPDNGATATPSPTPPPSPSQTPAPSHTPQQEAPPTNAPAPDTSAQPTPPAPSTGNAAASPAPTHPAVVAAHSDSTRAVTAFAVGGGLLAASLLTALASRRILQQRKRRPGRRIAMPRGTAQATERALRAAEAPEGTALIDVALRTAAVHLNAAGRELPELAAAAYGTDGLTLYLAEPATPVAPFTEVGQDLARWHCSATSTELLDAEATDDVDAPYPALVTIGVDGQGQTLLVDLERFGLIQVTGPLRHQVVRALAVELATSVFADHIDVTVLGPACPGLPALVPERCTQHEKADTAVQAITVHHSGQQQALTSAGANSLRQARLGADTAAAWTPHIVLAAAADAPDDAETAAYEQLGSIACAQPRTATAVITTSTSTPAAGSVTSDAWTIAADGGMVRIPGVDLVCTPQALSDRDYDDIITIIATSAADTPDVPAPLPQQRAANAPAPRNGSAAATSLPSLPQQPLSLHKPVAQTDTASDAAPQAPRPDALRAEQDDDAGLLAAFADFGDDLPAEEPAAGVSLPVPAPSKPPAGESTPADTSAAPAPSAPATEDHETTALPSAPVGPVVRVLGPVDVAGAQHTTEKRYLRTLTEIAAWIALHPGLDHRALDEAIWPGREVSRQTRNPWISRLRSWLGAAEGGTQHFPPIATTADARYRFADTVTTDWVQFQELVRSGLNSADPSGDHALRQALELVRGRPFAATQPRRYIWAEPLVQDMIAAIVDAAAALAERRLVAGDPRGAVWAAAKGLDAAPETEGLYRLLFQAYHAIGDHEALERAALRLDELNDALGSDMEEETAALLHSLLTTA
ncbi:BTAD domain-containing putative transcriptional regulator [Streptomyces sp. NPDC054933]